MTLKGVKSLFFDGCHSCAKLGFSVARQLERTAIRPLQTGQPLPFNLLEIKDCHSWSSPISHFHQTFLLLPGVTSFGVRDSFLVGCHSLTSSGWVSASDFLDLAMVLVCRLNVQFSMSLCNFGKCQNSESLYKQRVPPFRF